MERFLGRILHGVVGRLQRRQQQQGSEDDDAATQQQANDTAVRQQYRREAEAFCRASFERLGANSPAALLASDPFLLRTFCEEFVARHTLVEALVSATRKADADNGKSTPAVIGALTKLISAADKGDDVRGALARRGALGAVCLALQLFGTSEPRVAELGCSALWELALWNFAASPATAPEEIDLVLAAMSAHPGNGMVAYQACGLLCNASVNSAIQLVALERGAHVFVLKAMERHKTFPAVQEHACWALRNLVANQDESKHELVAHGGIQLLKAVLESTTPTTTPRCAAMSALFNISSVLDISKKMLDESLEVSAISAMAECSSDARLTMYGCGLLSNLCFTDQGQHAVARAGGVRRVMKALKLLQNDPAALRRALSVLVNIGANPANRELVSTAKLVRAVTGAMRAHPTHELIQEYACGAIWNATLATFEHETILEAGTVESIVSAMSQFSTKHMVSTRGAGALLNLGLDARTRARIVSVGGIEVLVGAIEKHPSETRANAECIGALGNIAIAAENKLKVANLGGVKAVVSAMRRHVADPSLQEMGTAFLWNISTCLDAQQVVLREGGLDAITDALRNHRVSERVQERGSGALRSIAASDEVLHRLITPDIFELLRTAREMHPNSKMIQHSLESIERKEHPLATRARSEGICSIAFAPLCSTRCCAADHCYCQHCCIPQRMFSCITCDTRHSNLRYCETCRERCHAGHDGFWVFMPGTCQCTRTECKKQHK